MSIETLTTTRLLLEPWREEVREDLIALYADPHVSGQLGTGEPIPRDRSEREFEWMLEHWAKYDFGWRSVIDKQSGEWLGAVGLSYLEDNAAGLPAEDVEIGWWLKPKCWGKGLATEAAAATRDEGFNKSFVDHIWARHNTSNPASGRIMEKIGMTFARTGTGIKDVPIRIYELTRKSWLKLPNRRPPFEV